MSHVDDSTHQNVPSLAASSCAFLHMLDALRKLGHKVAFQVFEFCALMDFAFKPVKILTFNNLSICL